jgi:Alpha-galactosyl-binding fungal lectin
MLLLFQAVGVARSLVPLIIVFELRQASALPGTHSQQTTSVEDYNYVNISPSPMPTTNWAGPEIVPALFKRLECRQMNCMDEEDGYCDTQGCFVCAHDYYCTSHDDIRAKEGPPPVPKKQCHGLESNKYLTRDNIAHIIEQQFCNNKDLQNGLNQPTGSFWQSYNKGTNEEVKLGIDWKPGKQIKPDASLCSRFMLGLVVDGCDAKFKDPNNPMNWKGGGSVTVDQMAFHVDPVAARKPPPKSPGGGCSSTYDAAFSQHWIWGNGWGGFDGGEALHNALKTCAILPDTFHMSYGLGSDGREWTVKVRTGVFQKGCVGHALERAGGPKDVKCSFPKGSEGA